jgi:hypothetical protein
MHLAFENLVFGRFAVLCSSPRCRSVTIHILDPDWYFKHSSHSNVYIMVCRKDDFLISLSMIVNLPSQNMMYAI